MRPDAEIALLLTLIRKNLILICEFFTLPQSNGKKYQIKCWHGNDVQAFGLFIQKVDEINQLWSRARISKIVLEFLNYFFLHSSLDSEVSLVLSFLCCSLASILVQVLQDRENGGIESFFLIVFLIISQGYLYQFFWLRDQ